MEMDLEIDNFLCDQHRIMFGCICAVIQKAHNSLNRPHFRSAVAAEMRRIIKRMQAKNTDTKSRAFDMNVAAFEKLSQVAAFVENATKKNDSEIMEYLKSLQTKLEGKV
jgi:hypothetical protein